jgi:hypothetical protein
MKNIESKETATIKGHHLIIQRVMLLIRNLSNFRRGASPDCVVATKNLAVIGDLSDIFHNFNEGGYLYVDEWTVKRLQSFLHDNPEYNNYFLGILFNHQ